MTEDDTFNALKRIPIKDMLAMILEAPHDIIISDILFEKFMNDQVWTISDYNREYGQGWSI
jgi:hypothetical protein